MYNRRIAIPAIAAALTAALATGPATAQVTPQMKAKIAAIGRVVDPPSTAQLYRPLQPNKPYKGVTVTRNLSYGPDKRNILDVFVPTAGSGPRAVLLFVPGGAGNKIEPVPGGDAFYDNVMLWAADHGMTGVNMQRRTAFSPMETGGDVAMAIAWVHKNIAKYGGDPSRVFVWGHSAGAMSLANYLSDSKLWGANGVGVKGAVLMSGPYNLAPIKVKGPPPEIRLGKNASAGPPLRMPRLTPEQLLATSNLPGLKALNIPLFVAAAELDPQRLEESAKALDKALCEAGKCPTFRIYKDHGHMSEIFAVNTADVSTSEPIWEWMKNVR